MPVTEVMGVDRPLTSDEEWTRVTATGTYDADATVVVRYRTRDGASGVDVVVPLVLADGTSVLVDRGWFATDNRGTTPDDVPAPPAGEVDVEGWVRLDATGDSTEVTDRSTRAISSTEIGPAIDREVLRGFVDVRSETPEADAAARARRAARPRQRPALLLRPAVVVLRRARALRLRLPRVRRGARRPRPGARLAPAAGQRGRPGPGRPAAARLRTSADGQSARSMPPSTGSMTPVTNDAAGESRKAAARPNSSGSP